MITKNDYYMIGGHRLVINRMNQYDETQKVGGGSERYFVGVRVEVECPVCQRDFTMKRCNKDKAGELIKYFIGHFKENECSGRTINTSKVTIDDEG